MTKGIRIAAATLLATLFAAAVCAPAIAPHSYERQFRETTDGPPSADFRLGTDSLGRDRFSRLLHGSRITLLLAPAGAVLTTFLAALIGGLAGMAGGRLDRVLMACSDLCMCLPWLFLMMALRAALPLDTPSWVSVALTFFLVAALSWPAAARSVRASVRTLMDSDFLLFARASGIGQAVFDKQRFAAERPVRQFLGTFEDHRRLIMLRSLMQHPPAGLPASKRRGRPLRRRSSCPS